MSDLLAIQQYLSAKGLSYIIPRIHSTSSSALILEVPRDRLSSTASRKKTSSRQLALISRTLERQYGRRVIVLVRDVKALDDIAISISTTLKHLFSDNIVDVHTSFATSNAAVVWVEAKGILDRQTIAEIEKRAQSELSKFKITCQAFDVISPQLPKPSIPAILRAVKVHAPAPLEILRQDLYRRGFSSMSERWISSQLDIARKKGWIVRDSVGRYVLTAGGIDIVPRSRTASSSDVDRMLLLARRKEW